jgi:hypothetical protein
MSIQRNLEIARHSLAALTFALALAGTNVAGATAVSSPAGDKPTPLASQTVDPWQKGRTLDDSVLHGRGSSAHYSASLWPALFSVCRIGGCTLAGSVLEETNSLTRTSISALETSMKWRSNSFNIAGSRAWSKLIVFTSTSINVRLPIN